MVSKKDLIENEIQYLPAEGKIALVALSSQKKIRRTRLQKLVFLISNIFGFEKEIEADAYYYGMFIEDLADIINLMEEKSILTESDDGYESTSFGKEIYTELEKRPDEIWCNIADFVTKLKSISDDELLFVSYKLFPEYTDKSLIKHLVENIPVDIAFTSIDIQHLVEGEKKLKLGDIDLSVRVKNETVG